MGFSDIASTAIMFIAVLVLTAGVATIVVGHVNSLTVGATARQEEIADAIKTDITIDEIQYVPGIGYIIASIKNTGVSTTDPDKFTYYFNNTLYIPNTSGVIQSIYSDTVAIDDDLLQPNEVMAILIVTGTLPSKVYEMKVTTQEAISATTKLGV